MEAYIDDSIESGEVLVLAGYIADSERWAEFSQKWAELLRMRPPWDYFKMSEIINTAGDESRERVLHHYHLIREYAQAAVVLAVPFRHINKVAGVLKLERGFYNPYYWAWIMLINALASNGESVGIKGPIDFIFDEQTENISAISRSPGVLSQIQNRHPSKLNSAPRFCSDRVRLPLQAADMFAWVMRRKFLAIGTIMGNQHYEFPWGHRMLILNTLCIEITEKDVFGFGYLMAWSRYEALFKSYASKWVNIDPRSPAYARAGMPWLDATDSSKF